MKNLKGEFFKTFAGYDSYEIFDADASVNLKVADVIVDVFHFTHAKPVIGLEQALIELMKDDVKITVSWDNWSGCYIMAHDPAGEKYIQEIGKYLDSRFNTI